MFDNLSVFINLPQYTCLINIRTYVGKSDINLGIKAGHLLN